MVLKNPTITRGRQTRPSRTRKFERPVAFSESPVYRQQIFWRSARRPLFKNPGA